MELLFHNQLKAGDLINVYTQYMLEESYEGVAILLEKHSDGRSFSLYNEKLLTKEEDRVIDHLSGKYKPLTREQERNNKTWTKINSFFEDIPTKEIIAIRDKIKKKVSRIDTSLIDLYRVVKQQRLKYHANISKIGFFFELFSDDQIVRYFQQKYIRYWSPTIFREERWLLEFIPEQYGLHNQMCLYNSPFRTYRKIRTIAKVSPSEDIQYCEIRKHTTLENGVSNDDRRLMRLAIIDYDSDDKDDEDDDAGNDTYSSDDEDYTYDNDVYNDVDNDSDNSNDEDRHYIEKASKYRNNINDIDNTNYLTDDSDSDSLYQDDLYQESIKSDEDL